MPEDRRLAAIMFTDIVGYTAQMGSDEDKAFDMLKRNHAIHESLIQKHNGTLIKEVGDGTLASFSLGSDAVRCAIDIQKEAKSQNIPLKIGIHEGEMVMAGEDVLGDGVNIASRLQEISADGSITISGRVYEDVKNKARIKTKFIGDKRLKNVSDPVKVYKVFWEEEKGKPTEGEEVKSKIKALYYIIAGIIVVLGGVIIWQLLATKETSPPIQDVVDKSIAVLPFRNESSDPENEFFCNAMMEEILTHLQKIADLKVKSRTAVEKYRGTAINIKTIEDELGVSYFLEGSVQKVGNNLRIYAQLIDVKSGDHLWAERYDGAYTDTVFVVQATIANRIASSLNAVITPFVEDQIDKRPTSDIRAYQKYIKGREILVKSGFGLSDIKDLEMAEKLYRESLEIDPEFAWGYSGLAEIYSIKSGPFFSEKVLDSVYYFAEKAIEYDPNLTMGYYWKGSYFERKGDFDKALDSYKMAVTLDPYNYWFNLEICKIYFKSIHDYRTGALYLKKTEELIIERDANSESNYRWLGDIYLDIEDFKKAEKYYHKALEIEPTCHSIGHLNRILEVKGEWDKAIDFLDSMIIVIPACQYINHCRFYLYLDKKEFSQAEKYFNLWIEGGNRFPYFSGDSIAYAYLIKGLGREQEAITILHNSRNSFKSQLNKNANFSTYSNLARIHAIMGENDEALKYLSEAAKYMFEFGSWGWYDYIEIDPTFENLRNDPKFQAIVKQAQDEHAVIRAQVQEIMERDNIDL